MIAYKVVRKEGDLLRSMYHPTFTYKLGEFVEAPVGGLLVFTNLEKAKKEASCRVWDFTFMAEVEDKVKLPYYRLEIEDLGKPEWVRRIWSWDTKRLHENKNGMDLCGWWPTGSAAYRRVKLLEEV